MHDVRQGKGSQQAAVQKMQTTLTSPKKDLLTASFVFGVFCAMCIGWAHLGLPSLVVSFLLFGTACFGLVTVAVHAGVTYPFRAFAGKLSKELYEEEDEQPSWGVLACPMCAGMWAGAIMAGVGMPAFALPEDVWLRAHAISLHGFLGVAVAWIVYNILKKTGAYE